MSINLSVELYKEDGRFGVYLADDGGSGIDVKGDTPEDAIENAKPYLLDFFDEMEEE